MNSPLRFGGKQAHDGRLNDGDKRHIRIGGDGNGPDQMRCQLCREKDRGRAVRAADNGDGTRLFCRKHHTNISKELKIADGHGG